MPAYGSRTLMLHFALPSLILGLVTPYSHAALLKGGVQQSRAQQQAATTAGLEVLRRTRNSAIIAQHRDCEAHFQRCWDSLSIKWLSVVDDDQSCTTEQQDQCTGVLCGSWLEANCTALTGMCHQVNAMCTSLLNVESGEESDEHGRPNYNPDPEENLVFIHIPKTAGTAIENAGYGEHLRWGRHRMFFYGMMEMPDGLYCAAHHVPPKKLPAIMMQIYRSSDVFCVTRHPYDRAVSEYKYLLSVPWGLGKPGVLEKEPCTPEGLNTFLQLSLSMVIRGQRYVNDCHMLPQTDFIVGETHSWCQEVLRFEEMPGVFNDLMQKRGYDSVKLNHTENDSKRACPNLNVYSLSEDTKAMLNLVYHRDFALLGYDKIAS